ncbi:MAG: hypothetical protein QNJ68_09705 [Microcoleaceae cyanobacterium MO_207.B10]|nr:hypothetical protein [Microcoleaceae cyanobacterium MO_207.B10]
MLPEIARAREKITLANSQQNLLLKSLELVNDNDQKIAEKLQFNQPFL